MIRPEVKSLLWRWREVIAAVVLAIPGLRWALGTGLTSWLGLGLLIFAGLLAFSGWQRARFRHESDGPGIVRIVEGRISYFGPLDGGFADLRDLTHVVLDGQSRPPHWLLGRDGQPPLAIPVSADGADALFDAFASLPGLDTGTLARATARPQTRQTVIWRRAKPVDTRLRLH